MPALATDKYPATIKKLFAPRPPLPYAPAVDYPPEKRHTRTISPIHRWKKAYEEHIEYLKNERTKEPAAETALEKQKRARAEREAAHQVSFERQMKDWTDPALIEKHETEVMKDPYCTLFVARLDYEATEVDLSLTFSRFGAIASIRIIRNNEGKSRGYGFVVFERESDAATCVHELAPTGVKIALQNSDGKQPRTALVDIERSRAVRNWKPRRLGGGLGGRGYTRPSNYHLAVASAAASGRRVNQRRREKYGEKRSYGQPYGDAGQPHGSYGQNPAQAYGSYGQAQPSGQPNAQSYGSYGHPGHFGQPQARPYQPSTSGQLPQQAYGLYKTAETAREKYAKYAPAPAYRPASNLRSVRNIRRE